MNLPLFANILNLLSQFLLTSFFYDRFEQNGWTFKVNFLLMLWYICYVIIAVIIHNVQAKTLNVL